MGKLHHYFKWLSAEKLAGFVSQLNLRWFSGRSSISIFLVALIVVGSAGFLRFGYVMLMSSFVQALDLTGPGLTEPFVLEDKEARLAGVNLFKNRVDDFLTETVGVATIQLNRGTRTEKNIANFSLRGLRAGLDGMVEIPFLEKVEGGYQDLIDSYFASFGAEQYVFGMQYRNATTAGDTTTEEKHYRLRKSSGPFDFVVTNVWVGAAPTPTVTYNLMDLASRIRYEMVAYTKAGTQVALHPSKAHFPSGRVLEYAYVTGAPTRIDTVTLKAATQVIETLTFHWITATIDGQPKPMIESIQTTGGDPADDVTFDPPSNSKLVAVRRGDSINGLKFEYGADDLFKITTWGDKPVIEWGYSAGKVNCVTIGADPVCTFNIVPQTETLFRITRPRYQGLSMDLTLDPVLHGITSQTDSCSPASSYVTTLHPDGDLCEGLVNTVKTTTGSKWYQQTYNYNKVSGDPGSCLYTGVSVMTNDGAFGTKSGVTELGLVTAPNEMKLQVPVTETATSGSVTKYEYDLGRLKKLTENYGTGQAKYVSYTYEPAGSAIVSTLTVTLPSGGKEVYQYESSGRVSNSKILDAAGVLQVEVEYQYYGNGRLWKINEKTRRSVTEYVYMGPTDNRVWTVKTTVNLYFWQMATYTYDTRFPNEVAQVKSEFRQGRGTQTVYTTYNFRSGVDEPQVETITKGHSSTGGDVVWRAVYTSVGGVDLITKVCSNATNSDCETYSYLSNGRLDYITDAAGYKRWVSYEDGTKCRINGYVQETVVNGAAPTRITVSGEIDAFGRLIKETTAQGSATKEVAYAYDSAGRLDTVTTMMDGSRIVSQLKYTYVGTTSWVDNVADLVSNLTTTYGYDSGPGKWVNHVTTSIGTRKLSEMSVPSSADFTFYGAPKKIIQFVDGQGTSEVNRTYTVFGELYQEKVKNSDLGELTTGTYSYDAFGRLTGITSDAGIVAIGRSPSSDGYQVSTTVAPTGSSFLKRTYTTHYNHLGMVAYDGVTFADGSYQPGRSYEYTTDGRRLLYQINESYSVKTPSNKPEAQPTWTAVNETWDFQYDELRRVQKLFHNSTRLWTRNYDGVGRVVSAYDSRPEIDSGASRNMTAYTYANLGRNVGTTYPDGGQTSDVLTYPGSPFAQQTSTYVNGGTTVSEATVNYDVAMMPTSATVSGADTTYSRHGQSLQYSYHNNQPGEHLSQMDMTENSITTSLAYDYDTAGRVAWETLRKGGVVQHALGRGYYEDGSLYSTTYPGGNVATYTRDKFRRITSIGYAGETIASYAYYSGMHLTSMTNGDTLRTFIYDPGKPILQGIQDRKVGAGEIFNQVSFQYDPRLRLVSVSDSGLRGFTSYIGYDSTGHSLLNYVKNSTEPTEITYGAGLDGALAGQSVDPMFRLQSSFNYDSYDKLEPVQEVSGDQRKFYWLSSGIQAVKGPTDSPLASFIHDPLGRIALATIDQVGDVKYVRDSGMVYQQNRGGNVVNTVYNPDTGTPLRTKMNGKDYVHMTDPFTNTAWQLREKVGSATYTNYLVYQKDIYPGAEPVVKIGSSTGPSADMATLPNLWAHAIPYEKKIKMAVTDYRLADPNTHRFLSPDPLGTVDSANLYQYVSGFGMSAVGMVDPMGLQACGGACSVKPPDGVSGSSSVNPTGGGLNDSGDGDVDMGDLSKLFPPSIDDPNLDDFKMFQRAPANAGDDPFVRMPTQAEWEAEQRARRNVVEDAWGMPILGAAVDAVTGWFGYNGTRYHDSWGKKDYAGFGLATYDMTAGAIIDFASPDPFGLQMRTPNQWLDQQLGGRMSRLRAEGKKGYRTGAVSWGVGMLFYGGAKLLANVTRVGQAKRTVVIAVEEARAEKGLGKTVVAETVADALPQAKKAAPCFPAGTLVATKDGKKPIETVKKGDLVLSKNMETGNLEYREVTETMVRTVDSLYELKVNGEVIEATDEHPFYVVGKGWVKAKDLKVGDELVTATGAVNVANMMPYFPISLLVLGLLVVSGVLLKRARRRA